MVATGKYTCSVAMLRNSQSAGIVDMSFTDYLFTCRPITFWKASGACTYKFRNGKLSYSTCRCRDILKCDLKEVGVDSKHFGLHSLRAGSASVAIELGVLGPYWCAGPFV